MDHDHSYKLLFSHHAMMVDLMRGFLPASWVRQVDMSTLERVPTSQVSDTLHERDNDLIWRVRWPAGWLYIYLMVEFQSTMYRYMAVRISTYSSLLYEGLIRSRQLAPDGRLPPVFPIVLYNGRGQWTAPLDLAELLADVPKGLLPYRPRWPYALIDESRYSARRLARMQNLVAALFRLENSRSPADVQRVLAVLLTWLRDPAQENLRRAFAVWLQRGLLPARLPTVSIPEVQALVEAQSMLADRVVEWTQQWKEEGLQEGRREGFQQGFNKASSKVSSKASNKLQQGLQQALEAEKSLLVRLARKRFGEECAQSLTDLLAAYTDTAALADIGEWIITADNGEAFLAHVLEQRLKVLSPAISRMGHPRHASLRIPPLQQSHLLYGCMA